MLQVLDLSHNTVGTFAVGVVRSSGPGTADPLLQQIYFIASAGQLRHGQSADCSGLELQQNTWPSARIHGDHAQPLRTLIAVQLLHGNNPPPICKEGLFQPRRQGASGSIVSGRQLSIRRNSDPLHEFIGPGSECKLWGQLPARLPEIVILLSGRRSKGGIHLQGLHSPPFLIAS